MSSPALQYEARGHDEDAMHTCRQTIAMLRTTPVVGPASQWIAEEYNQHIDTYTCEVYDELAALCELRFPPVPPQEELRARLWKEAAEQGAEYVHERLREVDPISAERIHPHNVKRVIRALEVYEVTGKPLSSHAVRLDAEGQIKDNAVVFGLTMQRERLYRRLDERVDALLAARFLDELQALLQRGYDERLPPLQGLGYQQMFAYLRGEMEFEQAVMLWKRDMRRYAKRQWTWFRREPGIRWVQVDSFPDTRAVAEHLKDIIAAEQQRG